MSKRWKSLTSKISKVSQIQDYLWTCKWAWYHKYFHVIGLNWSNLHTNKLRLQLDEFALEIQVSDRTETRFYYEVEFVILAKE